MPASSVENVLIHPPLKPNRHAVFPVTTADGAYFELLCVQPDRPWHQLLYWLPAMGVPARHYLPLAEALAERGIGVVIHEWRGIGSSDQRAARRSNWGYRELLLDDLPAGMAYVRSKWLDTPLYLAGHSLGGRLLLSMRRFILRTTLAWCWWPAAPRTGAAGHSMC